MTSKHHAGVITALVLLVLFFLIFWNKIMAMLPTASYQESVGGVPVPAAAKTAMAAATSPIYPDNAPVVVPYTPGMAPSEVSTPVGVNNIALYHPAISNARLGGTKTV